MTPWSRREFLAGAGCVGFSMVTPGRRSAWCAPRGLPVGIQLWTVNAPLMVDPEGTLAALRRIGFQSVETAGFGKATAQQFRASLDRADLKCPSAHLDFMNSDVDAVLADANALGAQCAVSSILQLGTGKLPASDPPVSGKLAKLLPMTLDDAKATAALANTIGEKAKRAGLQYVYHNHFFEFVDQGNGAIAYDVLMHETDPSLVQFEMDCGWTVVAGYNPVEFFRKYPTRIPMIHVKDFKAASHQVPPGLRIGAALGRGSVDYRPIFAAAEKAGLKHYFSEQEAPFVGTTELEAARISYDYLQSVS